MAGMGPPPSQQRRRRNADTFEGHAVTVPAAGKVKAPPLPNSGDYSARTRRWYKTWTESPQAAAFTVTDWQRLHMLAPLVDAYFASPDGKLFAEIRLNESLLGATHVDRLRARIKVEAPPKAPPAAPGEDEVAAARRRRLLAADAG